MKDSAFYIEEIKRTQGITSDYAVAKLLGIERNRMTHYKNGRSSFDSDLALKVAELSGHSAAEIILNLKASKTKDPRARRQWSELARRMADLPGLYIM